MKLKIARLAASSRRFVCVCFCVFVSVRDTYSGTSKQGFDLVGLAGTLRDADRASSWLLVVITRSRIRKRPAQWGLAGRGAGPVWRHLKAVYSTVRSTYDRVHIG